MPELSINRRRSPRVPARLPVRLGDARGQLDAETEDVGRHGCRVCSPRPLAVGGEVWLAIRNARGGRPLSVTGRVAWCRDGQTIQAGIAYAAAQERDAIAWFDELLRTDAELASAAAARPRDTPLARSEEAVQLYLSAMKALNTNDWTTAVALLKMALALAPGDPTLLDALDRLEPGG